MILSPVSKLNLFVISVGVDLLVVVPSPNRPFPLYPQVKSRPLEVSAVLCPLPNETEIILSPVARLILLVISVGVYLYVVVPSPNWPWLLDPHVKIRPLEVNAVLYASPNETEII